MPEVILNPSIEGLSGKMGDVVFRYNKKTGKTSISKVPDMTKVKWSAAQVAHRERMAEAFAYGQAAVADPQLRPYYVRMSLERKGNERPFDMAVSDYCAGNNLLGDKFHWDLELWRDIQRYRKRKRR